MSPRILLTVVVCALSVSSCATWLDSRTQTVFIQTFEDRHAVEGVTCTLANDKGQWTVTTPGEVNVMTSAQDLVVTCTQPNNSVGKSNAIARPSPGYLSNPTAAVVAPVGVPSSVDQLVRGVAQTYPSHIHVVMNESILITQDQKSVR